MSALTEKLVESVTNNSVILDAIPIEDCVFKNEAFNWWVDSDP